MQTLALKPSLTLCDRTAQSHQANPYFALITEPERYFTPNSNYSSDTTPPHPTPTRSTPARPTPAHPLTLPTSSHPHSYLNATLASLPPRFHIEHHPGQGYQAHFQPLTPGPGNHPLPTNDSEYYPTAELALREHVHDYIEDLILYEAFQTLRNLCQRFDGNAVINAYKLLKENNPDDDYYLDVEATRAADL